MENALLLLQIFATLTLFVVIWIVQLVRYPQFAAVVPESFCRHHSSHTFWITPVVAPPMILELASSVAILFYPPTNVDVKLLWFGLILTATTWISTALVQVPLHDRLARGFDAETHRRLVKTNWIRTAAWSLRGGLVLYFVWLTI